MIQAFALGCLCALILLPIRSALPILPVYILLLLTAFSEEGLKSLAIVIVTEKNFRLFDQVIDGVIYAVTVAMGFAFVENILYINNLMSADLSESYFWLIYFLRALTTTFAHGIFSGIFGFAYANAYLLPDDFIPDVYHGKPFCCNLKPLPVWKYRLKSIWDVLTLHVLFSHIFKNRPSTYKHTPNHLILEGIMSAVYLHFLYDVLIRLEIGGQGLEFLIPTILLFCGWKVIVKFKMRRYRQIIHRSWKPHELLLD